jgi:hypothetical protein
MRPHAVIVVASVLSAAIPSAGSAQEGTFVIRLGQDTVALDGYRWTGNHLEGALLVRTPSTFLYEYQGDVNETGAFTRFQMSRRPGAGGEANLTIAYEFVGDSAQVATTRDGQTENATIPAPNGVIPLITPAYSMAAYESIIQRGLAGGGDTTRVGIVMVGGRGGSQTRVWRRGDTAAVAFPGGAFLATLDAGGRLTWLSGEETTMKVAVSRAPAMDLRALAAGFAARDSTGSGLGAVSPRDSSSVTAAGATVAVNYGRPQRRGRVVYGNLVPATEVWRTGANAATHFTTDRPLTFGDRTLPPGRYTLFSRLTADEGTLIVNGQTGQWGTQYDASKDVLQIPLRVRRLDDPVESFTIAIDPTSDGGVVRLTWGTLEFSAPFRTTVE